MAQTEAQKRATEKWQAQHYERKSIKLHKEKDSDILEKLANVKSINTYIKDLIRADLQK